MTTSIRFHAAHLNWLGCGKHLGELVLLFGFATGRVPYAPQAKWLYSFRLFLGLCKIEVLWQTGKPAEL